jgi:hypothetical protein
MGYTMIQAAASSITLAFALQTLKRAGLSLESNGTGGFQIIAGCQTLLGHGFSLTADDVVRHVQRCLVR